MASITENSDAGGSVRVTIPATPFQVQANSGTSQPCREVYIIAQYDNTSECRVQIGAACTSTTGIPIPKSVDHAQHGSTVPLRIPIRDVNYLYFVGGTENDVVDILWRS